MVLSRARGWLTILLLAAAGFAPPLAAQEAAEPEAEEARPRPVSARAERGVQTVPEVRQYRLRAADPAELAMEPPTLPDLSPYTPAAIMQKIKAKPAGRVSVRRMVEEPALHEFVAGHGRLAEWAARQSTNPVAIYLEDGYMTPKALAKALPPEQFAEVEPGVFMLRLPLVIKPGATLHIDRATKDFRMSQERGAFIVNDSTLFVTGTRLTAWRESEKAPAKYRQEDEFRPFLISWGGSRTYITDSKVTSLGYNASKAYGVSLSQYSPHMDSKLHRPRPTGWILRSEFIDHYYGFYCYEADDIVIIGNVYKDNIVYGIDPHDRSRRLIIAHNVATSPLAKHGIIISREVNDSWIIHNRAFNNKLAGIVLDRNSVSNVVAYNESSGNQGDGITIYESPDNIIWGNRVIGNARHGIRLRNSVDIRLYENVVVANRLSGIYGHTKDLSGTDRNLKLDPFELSVSMVVVGGQLLFNRSGPVAIDRPLGLELYNVELLAPAKKSGLQMRGVLGEYQVPLLDILLKQRKAAVLEPSAPVDFDSPAPKKAVAKGQG